MQNEFRMKERIPMKFKRLISLADPQEKEKNNAFASCAPLQISQSNKQTEIYKKVQLPDDLENLYLKGIHGIEHTYRVLLLVIELAKLENLTNQQTKLLKFCAIFHDVGRVNDEVDYFHGQRSIRLLKYNNFFDLKQFDQQLTKFIIENHCINDEVAIKKVDEYNLANKCEAIYLLKIFKDADNLDRYRIGDFDPSFLRIINSFKLIQFALELATYHFEVNKLENNITTTIYQLKV